MTGVGQSVARGWAALTETRWDDARRAFDDALASGPDPSAWEGRSWAAFWLGDVEGVFRARQEAYTGYLVAGDHLGAARMAIWLCSDHLDFRGEEAIAQGWHARAARLLAAEESSREHGWLAFQTGAYAIELRDDTAEARRRASEVAELGRELEDADLEMLGLALEGLALVSEGAVDRGMRCLDEAALAATGGGAVDPVASSWTLCYVLDACERSRDLDRAVQWCQRMESWYARLAFHYGLGVCRSHRASLLLLRGEWDAAEAELARASDDLKQAQTLPGQAEAEARLGELRRRQGRSDEAAAAFARARPHPVAITGMASLHLDLGEAEDAVALLEGFLATLPKANRTRRADALDLLVRAHLSVGDVAQASAACDELVRIAEVVGTRPLRAAAASSTAAVLAAKGDHATARWRFEAAVADLEGCGLPFEAARTRIDLSTCLAALGRNQEAAEQLETARSSLQTLGVSSAETDRAEGAAGERSSPLTRRETEVLRLIAEGMSDRQVAARLHISHHTVHRHVANTLTKLGAPSRTAAVAFAAREGLL